MLPSDVGVGGGGGRGVVVVGDDDDVVNEIAKVDGVPVAAAVATTYDEIKQFLEGTHSLWAESVARI